MLQESLLALLDRVDKVREEHDKLEGENKFLQDYIGHLMQTSKITGSGGIKSSSGVGRTK
jgi:short coiled-coil protein